MKHVLEFFLLVLTVSLYSCQEIVIRNAKEEHLPEIEKLARTVFFEDIKPLILKGHADSPTVKKDEVDVMLENWLQRHYI